MLESLFPRYIPRKVKKKLVMAKMNAASVIVFVVKERAIPTEKLSRLTVKEKKSIDKKLVIDPFFSSFLDKNISIPMIKNMAPTM